MSKYSAFGSPLWPNDAGEFGDHRGYQAFDGICQTVHDYSLGNVRYSAFAERLMG
jgi:hypothetical protein